MRQFLPWLRYTDFFNFIAKLEVHAAGPQPESIIMRKLLSLVAAMSAIFLVSCQQEVDGFDTPGASTPRLLRTITRTGSDSVVRNYGYNSAGRITSLVSNGMMSGQSFDQQTTVVRNASNIITRKIVRSPALIQFGIDSLLTTVGYANGRYTFTKTIIDFFGFGITDSTAFQYDGSGKVTSEITYVDAGAGYEQSGKVEYVYSGANLVEIKEYSFDAATNAYTLDRSNTIAYDTKRSPVQFSSEAPVLGMSEFYSTNNSTRFTSVLTSPPTTTTIDISYTYNTNDLPITATSVSSLTGTSTVQLFYQ